VQAVEVHLPFGVVGGLSDEEIVLGTLKKANTPGKSF
jgi:hypothetical protein